MKFCGSFKFELMRVYCDSVSYIQQAMLRRLEYHCSHSQTNDNVLHTDGTHAKGCENNDKYDMNSTRIEVNIKYFSDGFWTKSSRLHSWYKATSPSWHIKKSALEAQIECFSRGWRTWALSEPFCFMPIIRQQGWNQSYFCSTVLVCTQMHCKALVFTKSAR